jgi:hypothetical protein
VAPLAPIMPYGFYLVFTASDLDAVVANGDQLRQ